MNDITLSFAALSDVGRARSNNEDAFQITDLSTGVRFAASPADAQIRLGQHGALLALSDGMGGHAAGEVASSLVVNSLGSALERADARPTEERLEAAIRRANAEVVEAAKTEQRRGMGATLTAVVVDQSGAYIAEVGDSRAYLLRSGRLKQLTRDQSLVQLLIDQGLMSREEAENSEQKNILLQAMGTASEIHAAIGHVDLRRADKLLLCSDGVSNALSHDELQEILGANGPARAAERMIRLANERGGADNLTAVVALVDGSSLEAPSPSETVTATFAVLKDFS